MDVAQIAEALEHKLDECQSGDVWRDAAGGWHVEGPLDVILEVVRQAR